MAVTRRTLTALFTASVGVCAAPALTAACLWDSDTLRLEASAFPGIAEVLTGRFERQPPRYYEMRLERVARLIEKEPANLDAYDDAGVACDRLGRSDEAVAWMTEKATAIAKAEADGRSTGAHAYRYHANLGSFHAHRWFRNGASREDLSDLRKADAEIAEAIRINPDAHFGREKYQLAAIRWLIELPEPPSGEQASFLTPFVERDLGMPPEIPFAPDEAVRGLTGLIVLGNAWESVDVHWALGAALAFHKDSSVAFLAQMRVDELLSLRKESVHPRFDRSIQVGQGFFRPLMLELDDDRKGEAQAYFVKARLAAQDWNTLRWAFMNSRFEQGKHPDTDADFWQGWTDQPPPSLPHSVRDLPQSFRDLPWFAIGGSVLVLAVGLTVRGAVLKRRRAATAAIPAKTLKSP